MCKTDTVVALKWLSAETVKNCRAPLTNKFTPCCSVSVEASHRICWLSKHCNEWDAAVAGRGAVRPVRQRGRSACGQPRRAEGQMDGRTDRGAVRRAAAFDTEDWESGRDEMGNGFVRPNTDVKKINRHRGHSHRLSVYILIPEYIDRDILLHYIVLCPTKCSGKRFKKKFLCSWDWM